MRTALEIVCGGLTASVLLLGACDNEDTKAVDGDRFSTILALDGDASAGESLYASNCAACHGAMGEGGSGPRVSGESTDETIEACLSGPDDMPSYAQWSDQDLADVAQFVAEL